MFKEEKFKSVKISKEAHHILKLSSEKSGKRIWALLDRLIIAHEYDDMLSKEESESEIKKA